ncbi:MAG: CinA family nicotinamide mononucleotide deamidase-related protein, partial [Acidobacteriota bacterium]|nr:CinA family nicotinamide mononucleotide deamidase-related protein [Acidobacteriota bacterium]
MADVTLPSLSTAAIIAIGTELLTPHRSDTNSLAITARLDDIGIRVCHKAVAGDRVDEIAHAIRDAAARADLVILSGGLGPTADDLTRDAIAAFAGIDLVEDPALVAMLESRFAARGIPMPAINRKQALVPRGAVPLANPAGSAPGLLLERRDVTVVALPGPPRELLPMFDALAGETLRARSTGTPLWRRVLKVSGRPESSVDEIAAPIYQPFERARVPIETTILASPGLVELHLNCRWAIREEAERALGDLAVRIADALGSACFTTDGQSIEHTVGALLTARGLSIAVGESCTAGLVAARLTGASGSSAYFRGGIVAYGNDVKTSLLDVPAELIDAHGAVSEPVARAMAAGAR